MRWKINAKVGMEGDGAYGWEVIIATNQCSRIIETAFLNLSSISNKLAFGTEG